MDKLDTNEYNLNTKCSETSSLIQVTLIWNPINKMRFLSVYPPEYVEYFFNEVEAPFACTSKYYQSHSIMIKA